MQVECIFAEFSVFKNCLCDLINHFFYHLSSISKHLTLTGKFWNKLFAEAVNTQINCAQAGAH